MFCSLIKENKKKKGFVLGTRFVVVIGTPSPWGDANAGEPELVLISH